MRKKGERKRKMEGENRSGDKREEKSGREKINN